MEEIYFEGIKFNLNDNYIKLDGFFSRVSSSKKIILEFQGESFRYLLPEYLRSKEEIDLYLLSDDNDEYKCRIIDSKRENVKFEIINIKSLDLETNNYNSV